MSAESTRSDRVAYVVGSSMEPSWRSTSSPSPTTQVFVAPTSSAGSCRAGLSSTSVSRASTARCASTARSGTSRIERALFYPSKAPLLSYAAAPIYAALRHLAGNRIGAVPEIPLVFFSRLLLTVLPTLVTLIFLRRFLSAYVDGAVADVVVVFYALGTLAFSYSLQFLSHQTTADLLFLGFYAAWRWTRSEAPRPFLLLAGFLAATAVTAEYTSAMVAGLIGLWVPFARPQTARSRIGTLVALRARGCGPSGAPGRVPLALLRFSVRDRLQASRRRRVPALAPRWVPRNPDAGPSRPDAFPLLTTPRALRVIAGPARGSCRSSAALEGTTRMERARARSQLSPWRYSSGYLYFTSSFSYESWGWTTGPRHMTGLVPFLLLPAALVLAASEEPDRRSDARAGSSPRPFSSPGG